MRAKALLVVICMGLISLCATAWAVDEGVLPTSTKVVAAEDKQFNEAMAVWYSHNYGAGEKLLAKFAKEHPQSRWAAEAELHIGCKAVFERRFDEARRIFGKLVKEHGSDPIGVKAKMRLANVAELSGNLDEAAKIYAETTLTPQTWDQFRYSNFRARVLTLKRGAQFSVINCGPVALAACLDAMGEPDEAEKARHFKPDKGGDSLLKLQGEAQSLGVPASLVEMSFAQLVKARLPVLAHVRSDHYVAVLSIDSSGVRLCDSIRGDYTRAAADLAAEWSGKVLTFDPESGLEPLSFADASNTLGGCCGQFYLDGNTGCDNCPPTGANGGGPRLSGPGSGGCPTCATASGGSGDPLAGTNDPVFTGGSPGQVISGGSPSWDVRLCVNNVFFRDTPIWYNPGRGPSPSFTISYTNENSDSGIFGNGCKTIFDTKVFFLPGNQSQAVLDADLTNVATSMHLDDAGSFPTSGTVTVAYTDINYQRVSEMIAYSGKSGDTLTGLTRGASPINAPRGSLVYKGIPDIQVHREDGRTDTYSWDDQAQLYMCNSYIHGELVKVEMRKPDVTDPTGRIIVITFRNGSKTYYRSANEPITDLQGRVHVIESPVGDPVTELATNLTLESSEVAMDDASKLPSKGAILLESTGEIIAYRSKDGNLLTDITRGAQGTDRASATAGASVIRLLRLTMNYDSNGVLQSITDANGRDTTITTNGQSGVNLRVTQVEIPVEDPHDPGHNMKATFTYDGEGYLTRIVDAEGIESYLDYGGVTINGTNFVHTALHDAFTPSSTEIHLDSVANLPSTGRVKIGGVFGEVVSYSGIDSSNNLLTGIQRPSASGQTIPAGTSVDWVVPYLGAIGVGSFGYQRKTEFVYRYAPSLGYADLWAVYERGPGQPWPLVSDVNNEKPTTSYSGNGSYEVVYEYPSAAGILGSALNWTGDLSKTYTFIDGYLEGGTFLNLVTSVTDEEGLTTSYGYVNQDRTSTSVNGYSTGGSFVDHYQVTRTDAKWNIWTNTWADRTDGAGKNLTQVTGPDNRVIQFMTYDSRDRVSQAYATDPENRTAYVLQTENNYTFDNKISYTDSFVMHSALTSAIGTTDTILYLADVTGFPTSGLVRVGSEVVSYGGKDAATNTLTNVVRGAFSTTAATAPVDTMVSAFVRSSAHYDEDGETRGFLTSTEKYIVDSAGQIRSVLSHRTYDDKGRLSTTTEPGTTGTLTTSYTYDNLDRVLQTTTVADGLTTTRKTSYSCCHALWEEDENGHRGYHVYDGMNRLTHDVTSSVSTTLALPVIYADDTTVVVSDGSVLPASNGTIVVDDELIAYASRSGNTLTVSTRGAQGTTAAAHDSDAAVGKVDAVIGYGYDPVVLHRKVSLTDANGHVTNYEYYKNNRLKKTVYPDGTWEQYTYDGDGHIENKITSNGVITKYCYDENGRLLTESSE